MQIDYDADKFLRIGAGLRPARTETEQLAAKEIVRFRAALDRILHPISYIEQEAQELGYKVDGQMAQTCAADPAYLRNIARDALDYK